MKDVGMYSVLKSTRVLHAAIITIAVCRVPSRLAILTDPSFLCAEATRSSSSLDWASRVFLCRPPTCSARAPSIRLSNRGKRGEESSEGTIPHRLPLELCRSLIQPTYSCVSRRELSATRELGSMVVLALPLASLTPPLPPATGTPARALWR